MDVQPPGTIVKDHLCRTELGFGMKCGGRLDVEMNTQINANT